MISAFLGIPKKQCSLPKVHCLKPQSSPPGDLRLGSCGKALKQYWLKRVQQLGLYLEGAPEEFKKDKEIVLAAVKSDGTALKYAADALRGDREFLLEAVRATRAHWLQKLCTEELQEDEELKEEVAKATGEGLIFTYYDNFSCSEAMRKAFLATGASVPGGPAYNEVMKELNSAPGGAAATAVSFDLGWWIG